MGQVPSAWRTWATISFSSVQLYPISSRVYFIPKIEGISKIVIMGFHNPFDLSMPPHTLWEEKLTKPLLDRLEWSSPMMNPEIVRRVLFVWHVIDCDAWWWSSVVCKAQGHANGASQCWFPYSRRRPCIVWLFDWTRDVSSKGPPFPLARNFLWTELFCIALYCQRRLVA